MKNQTLLVALAFLFAATTLSFDTHFYPVVYWSNQFTKPTEHFDEFTTAQVFEQFKEQLTTTTSKQIVVIVKEGLTTEYLIANAYGFKWLKNRIMEHGQSYTHVTQDWDTTLFQQEFDASTTTFTIESTDELPLVGGKVKAFFEEKKGEEKYVIATIIVKEAVPVSFIDTLSQTVETSVSDQTVFVLSGKQGTSQHARLFSFQQTNSTNSTTITSNTTMTAPGIAKYLYPNLLIGLLFMLFILSILIFGYLLLMDVQTPSVFSNQSIDFGKIEK